MSLIVQKFGGSSVANADKIRNVANIIEATYKSGNKVVVVVSAQGDTTDLLIEKAREINSNPSRREMDVLMSTGEQISIALLAMEIEKRGMPVVSLTGWQFPIRTDDEYSSARIQTVETKRIEEELKNGKIVVAAGFQGINSLNDITTLGRGGSDTTAVAIAGSLDADVCQIYTDVDGVFTADPRIVKNARKMDTISYKEMLELSAQGAQVLHDRSVEMAQRYSVNIEVLSSFTKLPGTVVSKTGEGRQSIVCGAAKDTNVSVVTLKGIKFSHGAAHNIFCMLIKNRISIDMIIQSYSNDNTIDIVFSTPKDAINQTSAVIEALKEKIGYSRYEVDNSMCKISVVGSEVAINSSVSAEMFEALFDSGIKLSLISLGEIRISVLVSESDGNKALNAVHDKFFKNRE